jgi:hypothetical protein
MFCQMNLSFFINNDDFSPLREKKTLIQVVRDLM